MAGGKPIETVMTTDVDGVIKGAEKVADSFEEIQDSLKDTAKAGDKSFEKLEDSSKSASDSMKDDAQAAAKVIDRDLTQALKDVDNKMDSTGKSGKNIGDGVQKGTDKAKGALSELKQEADSTSKEAGASFDGSAEGITDAFQEVAANMGPVGLAIAVSIGIAIAKMQELAEANNEASQASIDLAKEIYNVGGAMDKADLAEKIQEWAFSLGSEDNWLTPWADESISNIERVQKFAGENKDLAKAIFDSFEGDADKATAGFDKITEAINRDKEALKDHVSFYDENGSAIYDKQGDAIKDRISTGEELKKALDEERSKSGDAAESSKYYTEVMGESEEATKKRKDAEDELLKVQQDRIDAEEKLAETNRSAIENEISYNQQIAETTKGIGERGKATDTLTKAGQENNTALVDLSESGADYLQGLYDQGAGADVLAAKVAGVREQFIAQAVAAGYNKDEAEALAASYGLIPPEVKTKVSQEGAEETKAAVDAVPGEKSTEVTVTESGTAETQGAIDGVQGKDVPVKVTDDRTADETQKRIDGIRGRDLVKVDVDDDFSVKAVQDRINGIKGTDVEINVRIANLADIQRTLDNLSAARSVDLTINERKGTSQTP